MALGIRDSEKLFAETECIVISSTASPTIQYNNRLRQIQALARAECDGRDCGQVE